MTNWKISHYKAVTSTNDIALTYSKNANNRFVILADTQTAGRGRRGRTWYSLEGNLFFSIGIPYSLRKCGKLVILCSLSLLQTVKTLFPDADVQLKWPNDVLLNGAKVSGMLLEKGENDYIIVGIGVNIMQCPNQAQTLYPTTSLAASGIQTSCNTFLNLFLQIFDKNMLKDDFETIRQQWLSYAKNLNKKIIVRQETNDIRGMFIGIDENGNLLLNTEDGIQKIMVGDVIYG